MNSEIFRQLSSRNLIRCTYIVKIIRSGREKFNREVLGILEGKFHFESFCAMALTILEISVSLVSSRDSAIRLEHHVYVIHVAPRAFLCSRTNWISLSLSTLIWNWYLLYRCLERENITGVRYLPIFRKCFAPKLNVPVYLLIFIYY